MVPGEVRAAYDDIAQTIRHDLVLSEYGEDIENFIQYIPNTAETCHTLGEVDRQLGVDDAPVLAPASPFSGNIHHSQV